MTLEHLGFFRELRHGDPNGPSLADAVATPLPDEVREAVARYLRGAPVVLATSQRTDDVLDPARTDVSGISVHTDGTRVWSEDLAYYVETYGARVPDALVADATAGPAPSLSPAEVLRVANQLGPA